ncbi:MAG: lactonase family protein [Balneolaceae bacterium]
MKSTLILFLLFFMASITACESQTNQEDTLIDNGGIIVPVQPTHLFIGTYTRDEGWVNGTADGIYRLSISEDGSLSLDETAAEVINPSFVAITGDKKNLYSVSELGRGNESTGFIHAFIVNEDLSLTFIAKYPTNAKSPAHVSIDETGKFVFVANYQGGVAMVYIRNEDGSLQFSQQLDHSGSGPHQNQNGSHTHMVKVSPDNNYLFIPDLGSDKIWSYKINHETGSVSKTMQEFGTVAPGSGPRHMDFHPTKNLAYVMNELNSTVSVFDYDPESGSLTDIQTITTLPSSFSDRNSTADIHVHPNGKFLYGSNRGHNSVVNYSIDEVTGELSYLAHTSVEGEFPRNFAISPLGETLYVANQNTNNITVFDLNAETGALSYTGESISIGTPVCIAFF